MKSSLSVLILVVLVSFSALAAEDEIRSKPPGSDLSVLLAKGPTGDYSISIFTPDGTKAFSETVDLRVTPIIWNKKGTIGAFSAGTGFIMDGYVVFLQGPNYKLVKLPGPKHGWDNYHLTPVSWSDGVLLLDVDGPHAGKSDGYHFSGKMRVSLKTPSDTPKVIEEKVEVDTEREKN